MTRKKASASNELASLLIPREALAEEIAERITQGKDLVKQEPANPGQLETARKQYRTWSEYTNELLRRRFSTTAVADEYSTQTSLMAWMDPSFSVEVKEFIGAVRERIRRLESILDRLPLMNEPPGGHPLPAPAGSATTKKAEVFLVHGRNQGRKDEVARFLGDLLPQNRVAILHEQANEGRTIIEKFERQAAKAGYAVVLLTADDEGRLAGAKTWEPRARQNVVLELGFFFGALGRARVAVLYEEGVARPSDIDGLLYIPLDDAGAWRTRLAKELSALGVEIAAEALLK